MQYLIKTLPVYGYEHRDENGDDIVARLERLALMAEVSNHHTSDGTMRLMPAAGVADVLRKAMDTIVDLRIDLEVARGDAKEAETFAEELLDAADPKAKALAILERIAKHDHQGLAAQVLRSPPSGSVERTKAYADVLSEVASTDIQGWARDAIRQLKGEDQ